ncbi:transglutaminase domain-containing protein [Daejeonia sp. YH14]|uniref:transglutaminase domain-containing protein n=1 Tax=Daejeonia sp. YH14 TaxID=3439042 RepID=UPI003F491996
MSKILQVILLLSFSILFGQNNFRKIDSIAVSTKYKGNLNQLVNNLTQNLENEIDKTRAIYSWIVENINYDYKLFNKGKRTITFKCKTKTDCNIKKQEFENNLIEKVLRKKKGVCSGYSTLFKKMCDIAKIQCLNIDGYVKTKSSHVGNTGILDHAWNAVIIDNQTYFLDLTWASGYCENDTKGKLTNFVKKKNDFYWFTPVEKFTIDHFPKNPEKVLNFEISKDEYKNQPFIDNNIIPLIKILKPTQGILKPKIGDSITFKFEYSKNIEKLQINTNLKRNPKFYYTNKNGERIFNQKNYNKQEYIHFTKNGNIYEFTYLIENKELRYIEILFDYNMKLKYLIRID